MSITRINTNVDAMQAGANLRKLEFQMSRTMNHLATGLRINTGADDPSGVALSASFKAQVSGTRTAIQNAEDGLSMMALADTTLAGLNDLLIRMRDLAVRASTDATLTTAQCESMEQEIIQLKTEFQNKKYSVTFNGRVLFSGGMSAGTAPDTVGYLQVGADNKAAMRMTVRIPTISYGNIGGVSIYDTHISGGAVSARHAIDVFNSAMMGLSRLQTVVGCQEQALERKITELNSAEVNMAAASSRVTDADMAYEISQFARQQVIAQAATAMIAQANVQPQSILSLLGA